MEQSPKKTTYLPADLIILGSFNHLISIISDSNCGNDKTAAERVNTYISLVCSRTIKLKMPNDFIICAGELNGQVIRTRKPNCAKNLLLRN